jgi:hypothetical protein
MILGGINFGWNHKKGLKNQTLRKGALRPVGLVLRLNLGSCRETRLGSFAGLTPCRPTMAQF